MNHKQAANILVNAYIDRINEVGGDPKIALRGVKNVQDVFNALSLYANPRSALIELICAMIQPETERIFIKNSFNDIKSEKTISFNLPYGMGLKVKNKKQLEILMLFEESDFNAVKFGCLIANMLQPVIDKLKLEVKKEKCKKLLFA